MLAIGRLVLVCVNILFLASPCQPSQPVSTTSISVVSCLGKPKVRGFAGASGWSLALIPGSNIGSFDLRLQRSPNGISAIENGDRTQYTIASIGGVAVTKCEGDEPVLHYVSGTGRLSAVVNSVTARVLLEDLGIPPQYASWMQEPLSLVNVGPTLDGASVQIPVRIGGVQLNPLTLDIRTGESVAGNADLKVSVIGDQVRRQFEAKVNNVLEQLIKDNQLLTASLGLAAPFSEILTKTTITGAWTSGDIRVSTKLKLPMGCEFVLGGRLTESGIEPEPPPMSGSFRVCLREYLWTQLAPSQPLEGLEVLRKFFGISDTKFDYSRGMIRTTLSINTGLPGALAGVSIKADLPVLATALAVESGAIKTLRDFLQQSGEAIVNAHNELLRAEKSVDLARLKGRPINVFGIMATILDARADDKAGIYRVDASLRLAKETFVFNDIRVGKISIISGSPSLGQLDFSRVTLSDPEARMGTLAKELTQFANSKYFRFSSPRLTDQGLETQLDFILPMAELEFSADTVVIPWSGPTNVHLQSLLQGVSQKVAKHLASELKYLPILDAKTADLRIELSAVNWTTPGFILKGRIDLAHGLTLKLEWPVHEPFSAEKHLLLDGKAGVKKILESMAISRLSFSGNGLKIDKVEVRKDKPYGISANIGVEIIGAQFTSRVRFTTADHSLRFDHEITGTWPGSIPLPYGFVLVNPGGTIYTSGRPRVTLIGKLTYGEASVASAVHVDGSIDAFFDDLIFKLKGETVVLEKVPVSISEGTIDFNRGTAQLDSRSIGPMASLMKERQTLFLDAGTGLFDYSGLLGALGMDLGSAHLILAPRDNKVGAKVRAKVPFADASADFDLDGKLDLSALSMTAFFSAKVLVPVDFQVRATQSNAAIKLSLDLPVLRSHISLTVTSKSISDPNLGKKIEDLIRQLLELKIQSFDLSKLNPELDISEVSYENDDGSVDNSSSGGGQDGHTGDSLGAQTENPSSPTEILSDGSDEPKATTKSSAETRSEGAAGVKTTFMTGTAIVRTIQKSDGCWFQFFSREPAEKLLEEHGPVSDEVQKNLLGDKCSVLDDAIIAGVTGFDRIMFILNDKNGNTKVMFARLDRNGQLLVLDDNSASALVFDSDPNRWLAKSARGEDLFGKNRGARLVSHIILNALASGPIKTSVNLMAAANNRISVIAISEPGRKPRTHIVHQSGSEAWIRPDSAAHNILRRMPTHPILAWLGSTWDQTPETYIYVGGEVESNRLTAWSKVPCTKTEANLQTRQLDPRGCMRLAMPDSITAISIADYSIEPTPINTRLDLIAAALDPTWLVTASSPAMVATDWGAIIATSLSKGEWSFRLGQFTDKGLNFRSKSFDGALLLGTYGDWTKPMSVRSALVRTIPYNMNDIDGRRRLLSDLLLGNRWDRTKYVANPLGLLIPQH